MTIAVSSFSILRSLRRPCCLLAALGSASCYRAVRVEASWTVGFNIHLGLVNESNSFPVACGTLKWDSPSLALFDFVVI